MAIPTYRRGAVVLETVGVLHALEMPPFEILIIDQTVDHPAEVHRQLQELDESGSIRWIRLPSPSIPCAMNRALRDARTETILFLDDDIRPDSRLVSSHSEAQAEPGLVAGMVLQPGQCPATLELKGRFKFNSDAPALIVEFMGGNFSVSRDRALSLGGFDENFIGAAYRFEAEFAHRYVEKFGLIRYEPSAIIHHLAIPTGGTRAHGHHLKTFRPAHSVGEYYYLLRARPVGWFSHLLRRPFRAVSTRHHLRNPWWIPPTLIAETLGMIWAIGLLLRGPTLISRSVRTDAASTGVGL